MIDYYAPVLEGVTINAIGDSYFEGNGLNPDDVWLSLMAKKYGMTMNNYGKNGSTVSNYVTQFNPMCVRYTTMVQEQSKADIILVEGGRNDSTQNVPVGDPVSSNTDTKTYCGALNVILQGLKEAYPDAMLVCITPWNFNSKSTIGLDYYHYADAMKAIAEANGAYCIYACDPEVSGVDMRDDAFRAKYCMKPGDNSHLNAEGMKIAFSHFEKILAEYYRDFLGQSLRVMSFNVRMDLYAEDGQLNPTGKTLNAVSQNRVRAVQEQLLSHKPDLIGLQEDVQNWIDNIDLGTDYTAYRPALSNATPTQEYCSIYVKKGIHVKDNGWQWLNAGNASGGVALTYAELTNGDGKYDMSSDDLIALGITDDASLKNKYFGTLFKQNGTIMENHSYGPALAAHLMNWVVAETNGECVIYVNTHLQHRGTDHSDYSKHPLYMLRYYERCAEFDIVEAKITILKQTYKTDRVVVTGDFNDCAESAFYNKVAALYSDSKTVAISDLAGEDTWNSAFSAKDIEYQGQGYSANDHDTGKADRIDFCFVSDALKNSVYMYRTGGCQWKLSGAGTVVYPSDHLPVVVDLRITSE